MSQVSDHRKARIGDKIVEGNYIIYREQKNPHPSPSPSFQSWGICCFL